MANLSAIDRLRLIEKIDDDTIPGGEAIGPGVACRIDGSAGKAMIGNASDPTEADIVGLNLSHKLTALNMPAHLLRRGEVAAYDSSGANILAGMDYGALVYLSATDSLWADASPAENEVQTLTITGSPSGGTFTITFDGETTAAIDYDATAAEVQAALELLANIGPNNVRCSGGALPGTAVVIEFVQEMGNYNQPLMTTTDSLTGGTSPESSIAETNAGVHEVVLGRVIALWDQSTPTQLLDVDLR
jgi:hypothetical protein